jgi:hypothetical protein
MIMYFNIIWLGPFFSTPFLRQAHISLEDFVGILVETMTQREHFEINWPLVYSGVQFGIADSIRDHCNVCGEI